jgi:hypothetical protein
VNLYIRLIRAGAGQLHTERDAHGRPIVPNPLDPRDSFGLTSFIVDGGTGSGAAYTQKLSTGLHLLSTGRDMLSGG